MTYNASQVTALVERTIAGDKPLTEAQWDNVVTFATGNRAVIAAALFAAKERGVVGLASFKEVRESMAERTGRGTSTMSQWTTAYGYARQAMGSGVTEGGFDAALKVYGREAVNRNALVKAIKDAKGKWTEQQFIAACDAAADVKAPVVEDDGKADTKGTKSPKVTDGNVTDRTANWVTAFRGIVAAAGDADAKTSNIALSSTDRAIVADLMARLVAVTGVTPARVA